MKLIKWLKDIGKDDVAEAGGKGASLGEMTRAGFPVPAGFVILAPACGVMTDELADDILKNFDALGAEHVAVRSSATAEDGKTAAWAGQLETYLNTERDTLRENVERCWVSIGSARATAYRSAQGIDHATRIPVAVVVQAMVPAEVSGVAFSAHPVTGNRDTMIIEAAKGLGEALVSGEVTPDQYVVGKRARAVTESIVPPQEMQKLSPERILALADMVCNIEKHYGFPVDVEWSLANGEFFILQSRPITGLPTP
ncbi:hypothetical protein HYW18_00085 [Candidatus Uhrbacteria bacterium]|nr:hypothetical protein [Candidatus Uhrbacteria bacterium]